jgi:hypothetical protein
MTKEDFKMAPVSYTDPIEIPIAVVPIYDGTMRATGFEVGEPGQINTTNIIRTTQDWGVTVDWETHGWLAKYFNGTFHLKVLLERMGPDSPVQPDYALPEVTMDTLAGAFNAVNQQRTYTKNVNVAAGFVVEGTYKLVTLLQLYDQWGGKLPVAGLCEGKIIDIFAPA